MAVINGLDLFGGGPGGPIETIPLVEACDLVSYLVLQTNFITTQQCKPHEFFEAFVCGYLYVESSRKIYNNWTE